MRSQRRQEPDPGGLQAITKDWALILNWLEGTSLAAQWLGCHASTAGGIGPTPGHGTKILHATQSKNKNKIKINK